MAKSSTTLRLSTEDDTALLGQTLARFAKAGDCILLRGHIGAGKSALARAFIRERLGADTEVPSPTFTLVQVYDLPHIEIWHADLYRLTDTQEAVELGLTDAFDTEICLIEWPEILGDLVPENALNIELCAGRDAHLATLTYDQNWTDRLASIDQHA
ncbi:tRNA (adenosine(37)-N6)-threonylcarbamoyltransferase complex ATPase subunit type 1 TsaE [Octadecabacter sp. G9-8]|uniref:tRNA threonylcarbamoyladenosine biosynthesis protein TsaE n=1 Tax=Octadecabacter dasysiphoniae TaxID=2909341 RepID=A0ABS9CZB1_9RHOB|nr:tRNA (adenosine(37)-N6)-threonylcarbamoyltransferase complex ATPase subunit type 1 TsaE [Octadecabacter dasysiphoniae]MCF2871501.1 tRNA (adenosine(37)-N6)-threonylcarbamoyltransferase complex ATPase subunit type 1 TsaE [Octadecabacter dasysiphoniae]